MQPSRISSTSFIQRRHAGGRKSDQTKLAVQAQHLAILRNFAAAANRSYLWSKSFFTASAPKIRRENGVAAMMLARKQCFDADDSCVIQTFVQASKYTLTELHADVARVIMYDAVTSVKSAIQSMTLVSCSIEGSYHPCT